MRRLRALLIRLTGLVPNKRRERDLSAEFEAHLQMHIDDNLRAGMTPEAARRRAMLKLGGLESAKESYRDRRSIPRLENFLRDIRYALRQFRKNPVFAATALVMLTLGICAGTSIFAFVDAAILKPLPYRDPARLVGVFESTSLCTLCDVSYPNYLDWKRLNRVFSSLDVYSLNSAMLKTPAGAERAEGARVSGGFFRTLGVTPFAGRDFDPGEDSGAAPRTVILSYSAWQTRYGGRRDVLGQPLNINGDSAVVVGVLPPDFHFAPLRSTEFWIPYIPASDCDKSRGCHSLFAIGRLKDGASVSAAAADIVQIQSDLEKQFPDSNRGQGGAVIPLSKYIVGDFGPTVIVLLCGAGLLLVIACVNVVSLLLVRSEGRRRELQVRTALGGSRGRLLSQFVAESLVLTAGATVLGLICAAAAIKLLTSLIPATRLAAMPYLHGLGLDRRAVIFAAAVGTIAAVLLSLAPALHYSVSKSSDRLAIGSRGASGNAWRRIGSKMVVVELATAMVLLSGAGLLSQSLYRLLHINIGMVSEHLATVRILSLQPTDPPPDEIVGLERRLLGRISSLPGVESAALTSRLPIIGGYTKLIRVQGRPFHGERNEISFRKVSADYLATIRAKLVRGRHFTANDNASKPRVVIVDRSFAGQYFGAEDALGRKLFYPSTPPSPPIEIVGIVEDIREGPLDEQPLPTIYLAFDQDPTSAFNIVVRTSLPGHSIFPSLNSAIREVDRGIVAFDQTTMNERIADSPAADLHRSSAWVVGGFAVVALVMSLIGVYGVIAYSVSRRTREIGIRLAVGAQRRSVYRLILSESGRLAAAGVAIGLAASLTTASLVREMFFGVSYWDPLTLGSVVAVLSLGAFLASYLPARKASRVDPNEALRSE